jgi:heptosyltransferase-2
MNAPRRPLIVRLCNWVGEAALSLPTLTMLQAQGFELHLIGKRWAQSLFEGHGWPVHVRPAKRGEAIAQLRELKRQLSEVDAGFATRPNYLLFTSSFSSALEGRLAGLRPIGYQRDGRSMLLAHGVPWIDGLHAADNYWRVGTHFARVGTVRPEKLGLSPSEAQHERAKALMHAHDLVTHGFVLACPFSGAADTTGKKHWPAFPELTRQLHLQGLDVVICPGPGEEAQAQSEHPDAKLLSGVDLGTYAALALRARCTVSNDTGPGHLAAAVNGHVVSVLGPDAADMWWPQGEHVTVLKPAQGWPGLDEVLQAVNKVRP